METLVPRLDAVIDRALLEERIVGTEVLVARDGKPIYRRAAGFADREAGRPLLHGGIFRLASVTKPIVAATALALIDQGKLGLEDPVTRWLPDFRPKLETPAGSREPSITVRHLLTHTAGLSYGFLEPDTGPYHRAGVSDGEDPFEISLEENIRRIASVPLVYEPGTQWRYSVAFDVLGAVIARAGEGTFPELVERWVTGPLGMKDTGFTVTCPARLVTAYADGKPRPVRMSARHPIVFGNGTVRFAPERMLDPRAYPSGGGGMAGTAEDILTFLEALRKGGAPILRPETMRAMIANQIGELSAAVLREGHGYGLGVGVLNDPVRASTPMAKGTWRWGGAYGNQWWVDPKNDLTVVIMTNTALAGTVGPFPDDVAQAVYTGAQI